MTTDWPRGFERFLDLLRARAAGGFATKSYGNFYAWLKAHKEEWAAPMRAVLRDHLQAHSPAGGHPTWWDGEAGAGWLRAGTAQRISGLTRSELNDGLRRLGALPVQGPRSLLVHRQHLKAIISGRIEYYSFTEASSILGISRKRLDLLLKRGLLAAEVRASKPKYRFPVASVESLLKELESMMSDCDAKTGGACVAITRATHHGVNFADLVEAVLRGNVAVVGINSDATGLSRILVPPEPLEGRRLRAISRRAAAVALGICHAALVTAIDLKLLLTDGGRGRVLLTSIDAFRSKYVTMGELMNSSRLTAVAVRRLLADQNIIPVARLRPGRTVVFSRQPAVRAVSAAVAQLAAM